MAHEDIGGTRTIGVRVQGEPERIANYLQDPMNADPYDRALVQAIIRQYAANPTATTEQEQELLQYLIDCEIQHYTNSPTTLTDLMDYETGGAYTRIGVPSSLQSAQDEEYYNMLLEGRDLADPMTAAGLGIAKRTPIYPIIRIGGEIFGQDVQGEMGKYTKQHPAATLAGEVGTIAFLKALGIDMPKQFATTDLINLAYDIRTSKTEDDKTSSFFDAWEYSTNLWSDNQGNNAVGDVGLLQNYIYKTIMALNKKGNESQYDWTFKDGTLTYPGQTENQSAEMANTYSQPAANLNFMQLPERSPVDARYTLQPAIAKIENDMTYNPFIKSIEQTLPTATAKTQELIVQKDPFLQGFEEIYPPEKVKTNVATKKDPFIEGWESVRGKEGGVEQKDKNRKRIR